MATESRKSTQMGKYSYNAGYSWSTTTVTPAPAIVTTTTRTSISTPNYLALARLGRLPNNAFSFVERREDKMFGTVFVKQDGANGPTGVYRGVIEGVTNTPGNVSTAINAAIRKQVSDQSISKVLSDAKDMKINLAQAFAERQQTANLVATTAARFANAMRNLKKGDLGAAAENLGVKVSKNARRRHNRGFRNNQSQAVASGWLELQYGWKPLMNDVFGAAEAIANANHRPPRFRASATASRTVVEVYETGGKVANTLPVTNTVTSQYDVKHVVYFEPHASMLSVPVALGLTNPLLVAWELVPYSFVVDWFFPLGNWISNLDATFGLTFVGGSRTEFERSKHTALANGSIKRSYDTMTGSAYGEINTVVCTRSALTTWPLLQPPAFKNPVSTGHALNALALLTQLFRK